MKKMKFESEFYSKAKILPELTAHKIRNILLISSVYNIFSLEEGSVLASQIFNEYKGLQLEDPPRIHGVSSVEDALTLLKERDFDMVLIIPHLEKKDAFSLQIEIKEIKPDIPIILLFQNNREIKVLLENKGSEDMGQIFRWSGNPDLLLAIIKNTEDHLNVDFDTQCANIRVLILVEDSPDYYSSLLPIFYKEVINQVTALMEVGLSDKQRAMTMRARPKILLAKNYEEGLELCRKYKSYLSCLISDTRIPIKGKIAADGGIRLLAEIRKQNPEIPLLLMSTENSNRERAQKNAFFFINKNSPNLLSQIHHYFLEQLGFGDFIFRMENGIEVGRAANFLSMEANLNEVPDESIAYHAQRNDFSRWVMARSEIELAIKFGSVSVSDFEDIDELRAFIIININNLRQYRQKGVISQFDRHLFDANIREFVKIGKGSLGGKARGLAFMADLFRQNEDLQKKYPDIKISIPKTLVICTDIFETFVNQNSLRNLLRKDFGDEEITHQFLKSNLPEMLLKNLHTYLQQVKVPLSIRSSSQMEDAHSQPYAGLYRTYMIPNNDDDVSVRLSQLIKAIKLVYASTYFEGPKRYSVSTSNQHTKESMAVIIQQVTGEQYGDYFYPALSGVAQSSNYYPFANMKADEGIVHMALGLGKTVVDGEQCIRFSPKYPNKIPQFSIVTDILKNAQTNFYALKTNGYPAELTFHQDTNLEKRNISHAENEFPVKSLSSTYIQAENRIRDTWDIDGPKVLTFARVLKYNLARIPMLLSDLLELGKNGFGCDVEIEFAINLYADDQQKAELNFLQIRPMFAEEEYQNIQIREEDIEKAFCRSSQALGNGVNNKLMDIVYIKPDKFKTDATLQIAGEINKINAKLEKENRSYLLVGPGRWGGTDRWLGIPVKWRQISQAGAIVELRNEKLNTDPTQGSHFFQNITSLGIHYIMVNELNQNGSGDFFDWQWVGEQPAESETEYVRHVRLDKPMVLKIDGRKSECAVMKP